MSKLLLNEQPLLIMPTLASKIGLNESIVLQQIHYWNSINEKTNNNFRDGYYWTFNSYHEWTRQFPFWSARTVQRAITSLEKLKLVVSGNYNKLQIDRTKWYRIDYEVLEALEQSPFGQNGTINMTKWHDHLDSLGLPLPETNSETKPEINFIHLPKGEDEFISFYLKTFRQFQGKNHMKVKATDYYKIQEALDELESYDVTIKEWEQTVEEHFENLPKSNNGNILAFLKAARRYFDVEVE